MQNSAPDDFPASRAVYVLLSNDYEVFLGGNEMPEEQILCDRTDQLLETLSTCDVPMTFFADVACLWRYRDLGHGSFADRVERQLCDLIRRGHDVQAHLHPHWMTTQIDRQGGASRYHVDLNSFGMSGAALAAGEVLSEFAERMGRRARNYLENLLRPVDPSYRCLSYRAGGYAIQPGADEIFQGLRRAGFLIDSSIVPGMVLDTAVNSIDFRTPPGRANYWASGTTAGIAGEGLYEVPVAAATVGAVAMAATTLRRLTGPRAAVPLGGIGIQQSASMGTFQLARKIGSVLARILRGWDMLELSADAEHLRRISDQFIRDHTGEAPLLFSFSCHSKSIEPNKCRAISIYVAGMRAMQDTQIRFVLFSDLPDLLGLADADDQSATEVPGL